ncbi:hypothetical protein [Enterobacter kobei]|uniref:hypothetical protein n=1 Tax=Enterobacter kobei TaxID=208224 RepID=UPI00190FCC37|nr:hypothetical protein [Enterobacter kobei]
MKNSIVALSMLAVLPLMANAAITPEQLHNVNGDNPQEDYLNVHSLNLKKWVIRM